MDVPIGTRGPLSVPVGRGAKRFVKCSGVNDGLPPAASEMRHGTAAPLAERRSKAFRLRQVEACDRSFSLEPAERRGFDNYFAGVRAPGRFAAARAMTFQEPVEWSLDLKCDFAAQTASSKCRHPRLLVCCRPCTILTMSLVQ